MQETSSYSSSPKHERFILLDGLRGIACAAVICLHVPLVFQLDYSLPYAPLAVDFFFILSGFVIANAYEKKLANGLPLLEFAKIRLKRLYPMIFAGWVLGSIHLAGRMVITHHVPYYAGVAAIINNLLILPSPFPVDTSIFPVNGPEWSLFFELFINLAYAALVLRLTAPALALISLVSGTAFYAAGVHENTLAFGFTLPTFLYGFLRVTFSFSVGVLIFRARKNFQMPTKQSNVCLYVLFGTLALLLCNPSLGESVTREFLAVAVLFPALVLIGSLYTTGGWQASMCKKLGDVSYPLYATHYPVLLLTRKALGLAGGPSAGAPAVILSVIISIAAAQALMRISRTG